LKDARKRLAGDDEVEVAVEVDVDWDDNTRGTRFEIGSNVCFSRPALAKVEVEVEVVVVVEVEVG
jgi:hypothetical protein